MKVNNVPLETKHLLWVIGWALEKCADNIEAYETQITVHERFKDEPLHTRWGDGMSRAAKIASLRDFLTQYRAIHTALILAKDQASERSAQEFAEAMKEMFGRN